ncbi:MAG: aldo/keto reductase [Oscillospiraceae bacterium]
MRLPLTDAEDKKSIDMPQLEKMVDTFLERGFTYFDTAYMYHDYQSEIAIREALVKRHPRDSFTLTTKLPTMFLKEEGDQERIFNEQLSKCGVEYFDYYLLHNLGVKHYEIAQRFDSFAFVQRLKEEGKVKHIGFSFHDKADVLDRILTEHPEVEFVQLQINYLDWESESVQSRKCLETAIKHGKQVIIMEPVKGGALAELPKEAEELLKGTEPDMSVASWAVRFAASQQNVFMVLSGMSNMQQILDNTDYMQDFKPLSEEERELVFRAADITSSFVTVPCTACRYCVEGCPMSIPIPEYFSIYNAQQSKVMGMFEAREKYNTAANSGGKASECVECRACEGSCPQHIEITKFLKDVAAVFEA